MTKSELIEKISWLVAVISINLGTLSYGIIAGFLTDIEEPWDGGLGGMWWTMFLLSLIFAAVVYNERIKALISSLDFSFGAADVADAADIVCIYVGFFN